MQGDAPAEATAESYATTYTDADGMVYDWDFERQGWFPRVLKFLCASPHCVAYATRVAAFLIVNFIRSLSETLLSSTSARMSR